jgi:predicted esterase YcpF (UPF0227 family)
MRPTDHNGMIQRSILYLHGFRSSPQSMKARLMADTMRRLGRTDQFVCPQLPASPKLAMQLAAQLVHRSCPDGDFSRLTVIGSSLGGFYATSLAEQFGCHAVLLNPAVKPPRDLSDQVGVTTAYHSNEVFEFLEEYLDELEQFAVSAISRPERYFLIAATGDEVLDWREMVAHYPNAKHLVIEGSNHAIDEFSRYIDQIMAFCDAD